MNVVAFLFAELAFIWSAIYWLSDDKPRMRRSLALAVLLMFTVFWLSGCGLLGRDHVVVRPQAVEVPKYLREPLPAKLVQPCEYAKPDPACWRDGHREFCNKQLLQIIDGQDKVLGDCSDDKAALRALDAGKT